MTWGRVNDVSFHTLLWTVPLNDSSDRCKVLECVCHTGFRRSESRQPEAEGRERCAHQSHQQTLQIEREDEQKTERERTRNRPPLPTPTSFSRAKKGKRRGTMSLFYDGSQLAVIFYLPVRVVCLNFIQLHQRSFRFPCFSLCLSLSHTHTHTPCTFP